MLGTAPVQQGSGRVEVGPQAETEVGLTLTGHGRGEVEHPGSAAHGTG